MFATLAGGYPVGPLPEQPDLLGVARRRFANGEIDRVVLGAAEDAYVAEIVEDQLSAGLDFPCDGFVRGGDPFAPFVDGLEGLEQGTGTVDPGSGVAMRSPAVTGDILWRHPLTVLAWQSIQGGSDLVAKALLPGPYTFGRLTGLTGPARERATLALAEALGQELRALADAGCQIVQVNEDAAAAIGTDDRERSLYWRAHRRLTEGVGDRPDVHLSLALTGGDLVDVGSHTVLDAPYRSYVLGLLGSPANWRLVYDIPGDRGIICGVVDAFSVARDDVATLVWAMRLVADARDRGDLRVGIAPSGSMAGLRRDQARAKLEVLGEGISLARAGSLGEVALALDASPETTERAALRDLHAAATAGRGLAERGGRGRLPGGRQAAVGGAGGAT